MKTCIGLSACFLILYVLYHMTSDPTPFGGKGVVSVIYYVTLISHILLSVTVIPFVLFTFSRALAGNFERHKALAKFTFPIWLYVAVTGVVVYLKATVDSLWTIKKNDSKRPLLRGNDARSVLASLLETREPLYAEIADLVVETAGYPKVSRLVNDIVNRLVQNGLCEPTEKTT